MRHRHRLHALVPVLLAAAVLAACDRRDPAGTAEPAGGVGLAPLIPAGADAIRDRYVVVMHPAEGGAAAATAEQAVRAHGGKVHHTYGAALTGFAATLPPAAVDALRRNPRVAYVAEDGIAHLSTTQTGAPWGLDRVDQRNIPLNTTYEYGRTGTGVRVYVIDSGIRTSHAEFGGRASVGADFVGDGQNGQDCRGHGTHVAGTIAGATYGVAKAAQVVSVRVFGCSDSAEWSTVIAAVDWVTANAQKPAVANMSLGGGWYAAMSQAVRASIASGVVYTVAAGNADVDACGMSPASTPEAITVGSSTSTDTRSDFSNWGGCLDLFAPGSDIPSAWWTSDTAAQTLSGTSMAAPHAAGVAALYLEGNPAATPATVASQLVAASTGGRLTNLGAASPNRLLFSPLTLPAPGAVLSTSPDVVGFDFVQYPTSAAAAARMLPASIPRQAFIASGSGSGPARPAAQAPRALRLATVGGPITARVLLSNTGSTASNWTAVSDRPGIRVNPGNGVLNAGYGTYVNVTVDTTELYETLGYVEFNDPGATNGGNGVSVQVHVKQAEELVVGTPITGLWGDWMFSRYYVVSVPSGATALSIGIQNGWDVDLQVRYGDVPSGDQYDCHPVVWGGEKVCHLDNPLPGIYFVAVWAKNDFQDVTVYANVSAPPTAPRNLAARGASPTSARLDWTDAVNETGYTVSRRSLSGGSWGAWADVGSAAANAVTFTQTGLLPGSTHQYRLRACNTSGCSAWAEAAAATLPGAPAAPLNLAVVPASGSVVNLTWTDASTDETSFAIVRSLRNPDGTWTPVTTVLTPAANSTSATDRGLLTGREYRYQIRACNATGCSAWTAPVAVLMPSVPAAPSTLAGAQTGPGTLHVYWPDAASETSYTLARAPVSSTGVVGTFVDVATLAADQLGWTDSGLALGMYRYRIRACNLAGCSGWAPSADMVVSPPPSAPGNVAASALSPTTIRLTWVDTSPAETSVQIYRALRSLDGTWPSGTHLVTQPVNTTLYDNTGLLSGREYRYWVRACNPAGCSVFAVSGIVATP